MQRGTVATIASIIFIGAASAFVLLHADPEYVTVMSDNRLLTITGYVREGGVSVTQQYGEAGDEFTVTSGAVDSAVPLQLRFAYPFGPAWNGDENVEVARYDEAIAMWEWQDAARVDNWLVVYTSTLGRFALHDHKTIAAPDFVTVYDALRADAPANAVGYRIAVGYSIADDEAVFRLDGVGEQGGCNGAVMPGEDTAYATSTRTANVLVNDVQTPVTFTFVASWYVVDGGSCPEGQAFVAADDYGILPTSR